MRNVKIIPIRDQIASELRSDIISGELEANEKLNEQALANRFGVSRGPIRDVLLQLTKEGLLVAKNNCGVTVNGALSPELQKLMVDIRLKIEIHAIASLGEKLTESDFKQLDEIIDEIQVCFDSQDFTGVTKADIEFHRFLVEKSGGSELVNIWLPIVLRMRMNYKRISETIDCVNEHRMIVDALKARDIKAATAAIKHNIK